MRLMWSARSPRAAAPRRLRLRRRENEKGLADLDLIARLQQHVADGLVVDEGAVGAAAVEEAIALGRADKLGVAARHFGIVQPDAIGAVASGPGVLARSARIACLHPRLW